MVCGHFATTESTAGETASAKSAALEAATTAKAASTETAATVKATESARKYGRWRRGDQ
jgi:hypothetical protein